ncbi:MAG: hypothetical protein LBT27_06385 [Prevotellaceae bacterium]|jgi:hypothetical protein|nr:hypothetical protein [Prevotellaceae bacterium]
MKYVVEYKKLVLQLLPTFLRKPFVCAFMYSTVQPVMSVKFAFDDYRTATNYRLNHNGQVCYLRAVLNDYFDPILRRITIGDAENNLETMIIYLRETENFKIVPKRPSALILNKRGFGGVNSFDFTINVPAELMQENDRITAITNIYKLASKRYSIKYI